MISQYLNYFSNLDLFSLGVSASAIGFLGFVAYFNDRTNATSRNFFFFSIMTCVWNLSNFFQYYFPDAAVTLFALRINLFFATIHAYSFFRFAYVFPKSYVSFPRWHRLAILPLTIGIAITTLTPFVFSGIDVLAPLGQVTNPSRGPGIVPFTVIVFGLLIFGIMLLARKTLQSSTKAARTQMMLVLIGMTVSALLILVFSMILPVFFNDLHFLPYSAVFMLPFIGMISYSIYRFHLFNMKVFAVQALTYALAMLVFIEILFTTDVLFIFFRIFLLAAVIVTGIILTRSVVREVEQRELIQRQEKELEQANMRQENLLHVISHEIKGYLAKGQNAFAAIAEGDYGEAPAPIKALTERALAEMRSGVETVTGILEASNLKSGQVIYKKEPFDLAAVVQQAVDDLMPAAVEKQLQLRYHKPVTGAYTVVGDEEKVRHSVVRNIIDNSIKYTPSGSITVNLVRSGAMIRLEVMDTGVGITQEDKRRLFMEGGRGKDSIKINVHSTGFGLYIAKQIVEAHGGRIWAESEGAGKGSVFVVELPAEVRQSS